MTEQELRITAARVLNPGSWRHNESAPYADGQSECMKCGCSEPYALMQPCPVPDPDDRPLEVIAEALIQEAIRRGRDGYLMLLLIEQVRGSLPKWWHMTTTERIEICLRALRGRAAVKTKHKEPCDKCGKVRALRAITLLDSREWALHGRRKKRGTARVCVECERTIEGI